tara:strand:+ start:123 stop:332 length:210 start_codon:yes stop_codon:yes gene_type:complete
MTQEPKPLSSGHPKPITELTLEQDLKMRVIEDGLRKNYHKKEDVILVFLALQEQNFLLGNNIKELLKLL